MSSPSMNAPAPDSSSAMTPANGDGHPFSLPGEDFLALHLVAPIDHILLHEQSLAHGDNFHHHIDETREAITKEIVRQIEILAGKVEVDVGLLHAAYTAQRRKNQDKSIPERFLATSQDYNPADEDEDAMISIEDVQGALNEDVQEEDEQEDESQLEIQMPVISDTIQQLQKRVAAMSRGYNPPVTDKGLPLPQQLVYSRYDASDLDTDLEGPSALELYHSDISSITTTNMYNFRDILTLCLFYTNQEVFGKLNLCREGRTMRILKLESHGTLNTAIIRHCVLLAHAYQIKYDVLQDTWDRQRESNQTVVGRKRAIAPRTFSVIEQAKAYAIIDKLQNYASGHSSLEQLEKHLENRKRFKSASNEDVLSGKVSFDGKTFSHKGKYRIIEVTRGGKILRVVVDNRRTTGPRQT